MRKGLFLLLMFTYIFTSTFAQSWSEVKSNKSYLYGEGWGATVEEADQQALGNLISKISIIVNSDFVITEDERSVNGTLDAQSYTKLKIETYSSATLTNTERIVINNDLNEVHIGRFIKRTELSSIFEGRKRSIKEYIRLAQVAEEANKVDDALRNYYWAFSLLKSIQHPGSFVYSDDNGNQYHPLTWLPEKIDNIFDDLSVSIIGNDETFLDLNFEYKTKPVSNLDFTYFDGRNWSNICSAKNGRGTIEFSKGMVPNNVLINYEYAYRSQAHVNQEIKSVLDVISGKSFPGARVSLQTERDVYSSIAKIDNVSSNNKISLSPVNNEKPYLEILNEVVTAIRTRSYDAITPLFTEDGQDMFDRLIRYGNGRVLNSDKCTLYQFGDNVTARSIQMSFSFRSGVRKNFVEDIVFTFNNDGKIDCVSFGLDKKAMDDIMSKDVWPIEARQTLIEFLENYKTAYALKRIDYLRTIFDDDAVIIVGHVANYLEKTHNNLDAPPRYNNHKYVARTQYSKEQYLKRLEACFRSNEYINIRFANNDVRKALIGEEYGIQIKQDYYSTNYGDEGYLYIQVDLNDRNQPIIKVRTWQVKPDPEIGLFGIGNW